MSEENINDPKAYELTITLHEHDELLEEAEFGLPPGFEVRSAAAGAPPQPVTLVEKRRSSRLKGLPSPQRLAGEADTAIAAIKLAWDFIERGAPKSSAQGASTAVLASADPHWDHYAAAKKFASKTYKYRIKNGFRATVVAIDYVMRGSYKAAYDGTLAVREGDYMPNIEVFCSKIDLGWGWNVNAKAVLSHLSNVGGKGDRIIPDFYTTLSFNFWTILCNHTDTYSFSLRGDKGFNGAA